MNIHVPQSLPARVELLELSAAKTCMVSPQSSNPTVSIVQDSLTSAYLMTKDDAPLTKGKFFDISIRCEIGGKPIDCLKKIRIIQNVLVSKGKKVCVYNGKALVSLILPEDFNYEKKNKTGEIVKIHRGVMYDGVIDKGVAGDLVQTIYKEYGKDDAVDFVSNLTYVTNEWLLIHGFSVGLEDCLINSPNSAEQIQDRITKCYIEADGIYETTSNPRIREVRVTAALSKAKDIGMKIAKDAMSSSNNFLSTVNSGSKGDFFNISQLTGLLGQQNLLGGRVIPSLNHGKRTLYHYPFGKLSTDAEYESKGFIKHSFIEGLNPQEFFFHAMSGREGVCDTAMGTSRSGYLQRRIVKICEDIQVKYDGTVRDTIGNIYQMSYGDNGFDPSQTVRVGATQQACDISRLVSKLNLQQETKPPMLSKIVLLKRISARTGRRDMYKDWSVEELTQRLEALDFE